MHIKKTWGYCFDQDIRNAFDKVWNYVSVKYKFTDKPSLYLDKAASIRYLGIFVHDRQTKTSAIILNKLFVEHKEQVLNTIIHEFAHYVADNKYKDNCHHDYRWQLIANDLGKHFGEVISHYCEADDQVLIHAKQLKLARIHKTNYIITCDHCGAKWTYKKQCWWFKGKDHVNNKTCTCPKCKNHEFSIEVKKG